MLVTNTPSLCSLSINIFLHHVMVQTTKNTKQVQNEYISNRFT